MTGGSISEGTCIAISASGQYQTVGTNGSNYYRSTNYGATWSGFAKPDSVTWNDVAMSSNGQYQLASSQGASSAYVYLSTDYNPFTNTVTYNLNNVQVNNLKDTP